MGTLSICRSVCLSLSPLSTALERNTVSLFAEVSGLSPELLSDMDDGADLQGRCSSAVLVHLCHFPAGTFRLRLPETQGA